MATSKGNEGVRSTVTGLEDIKKSQGDYNNLLKESINLLKQMDKQYDTIEGRLESMSKSTINVKDIEKEIEKAKTKQYVISKQLASLEKSISDEGKNKIDQYLKSAGKVEELEKRKAKYQRENNLAKAAEVDELLNKYITLNERQKEGLSIEESSLMGIREANRLSAESVQFGEQKLQQEKEIRKTIGFTGAAMGFLADKLGIGASYQEDLVEKAKELQSVGEKLTFGDKLTALGKGALGALSETFKDPAAFAVAFKVAEAGLTKVGDAAAKGGDMIAGLSEESGNVMRGLAAPVADLVSNIPLVGGLLGGLMKGFAGFLDLLLGVDDAIVKMGRQLNLSDAEAQNLNKQFAIMSRNSGDVFLNSKKLRESQLELSDQLGINNILSKEQLDTNNKLKEFAGLEAGTRAKIAESSIISGKSSKEVAESVISQVAGLKQATGISFNYQKILGEASQMGGVLGLEFAKYPGKLTKALVSTKALGLELKTLEGMADSFLDFESSITKEFEAQLLTGKNINLTKARELFLNNDLAGAALEITKQVGSAEEFLKMNRIEAESYAQAMGMSRDQMADMLKQQELLSKFGAKDTKDLQNRVALLREEGKEQEAIRLLGSQQAYDDMVRASTQEKMMGFIEKIKQSLVDFLQTSGIVEKIKGFIEYLSEPKNVKAVISKVQGFVADAVEFIAKAASYILDGLDIIAFGQIPNSFIESIKAGGESMGAQIRSLGVGGGAETPKEASNVGGNVAAQSTAKTQGGFANTGQKVDRGSGATIVIQNRMEMSDRTTTQQTKTFIENDKSLTFGAG